MRSISLCMIVKNEEAVLERCLESVKDAVDEIIIVDTGSTDRTREIAEKFTDKVYNFEWEDDFSKARNFSFKFAKSDYVMWLDADDIVPLESLKKLVKLRSEMDGSVDVYMLKYNTAFDESNNPTFSFFRERIMKNDGSFVWQGFVHEAITPHGEIRYCDISVEHRKNKPSDAWRNLNIYRKHIRRGEKLGARESYYYSRELFYHKYYKKCIVQIDRTMKMSDLWIEDRIGGAILKASCLQILGESGKSRRELCNIFEIAPPRAKVLCMIGDTFMEEKRFKEAIFWYRSAIGLDKTEERCGFIESDYFGYYPALNLCVCYFHLGDLKQAEEYNDFALSIKPKDLVANNNKILLKNWERSRK